MNFLKTITAIFWNLMPGNPVFQKVVYGGGVRMQHFWLRLGYLGGMIFVVFIGLTSGGFLSGSNMGLSDLAKGGANIFAVIAYAQLLMVCLVAPIFMAGAIREEHASETLEILLTTPLSNLQIIWGSLLGRLFLVLSLLFCGLPLFAILQIFGGVPMSAVLSAFFVAALTAVVVGSIGVVLAVMGQDGRKGVFVFVIATMGFFILTYAGDKIARQIGWHQAGMMAKVGGQSESANDVNDAEAQNATTVVRPNPETLEFQDAFNQDLVVSDVELEMADYSPQAQDEAWEGTTVFTPLNPILVFESQAYASRFGPSQTAGFGVWMARPMGVFSWGGVVLSLFLSILSTLNLRTAREENKLKALLVKWLRLPDTSSGGERISREVWSNPVAWREAATRARGFWQVLSRMAFPVVCTLICWGIIGLDASNQLPVINRDDTWMFRRGILVLMLIELAVIMLVSLYMSAGSVSKERDEGTLDLVLSTPITPKRFIWGKLRGVVSFVLVLMLAPIMTIASSCIYSLMIGEDLLFNSYLMSLFIYPLVLLPFIAAVVAVGMYFSIRAKSMIGAIVPAISVIFLIGSIGGFCSLNSVVDGNQAGAFISSLFSPPFYLSLLSSPIDMINGYQAETEEWMVTFVISGLFSAAAFSIYVYAMISQMVRQFDYTVRKLSGKNG